MKVRLAIRSDGVVFGKDIYGVLEHGKVYEISSPIKGGILQLLEK